MNEEMNTQMSHSPGKRHRHSISRNQPVWVPFKIPVTSQPSLAQNLAQAPPDTRITDHRPPRSPQVLHKLASSVFCPLSLTHPTQPHWLLLSSQHAWHIPVSVAWHLLFCLPETVSPHPHPPPRSLLRAWQALPKRHFFREASPEHPVEISTCALLHPGPFFSFFNHSLSHYLTVTCLLLLPSPPSFPLFFFFPHFSSFPLSRVSLTRM